MEQQLPCTHTNGHPQSLLTLLIHSSLITTRNGICVISTSPWLVFLCVCACVCICICMSYLYANEFGRTLWVCVSLCVSVCVGRWWWGVAGASADREQMVEENLEEASMFPFLHQSNHHGWSSILDRVGLLSSSTPLLFPLHSHELLLFRCAVWTSLWLELPRHQTCFVVLDWNAKCSC